MGKVLVVTVGTGPGVEEAIVFSIRETNPELVAFLVSDQSGATLERVAALLGQAMPSHELFSVSAPGDVEACYRASAEAVRTLRKRGKSPAEITCDFTSGTKAMSAGLAVAAQAEGCTVLSYVDGRRGPDGRVISGTERLMRLRPVEIWLDVYRRQLADLFNRYQFVACLEVLDAMSSLTGDPEATREIQQLRLVVEGYDAWDKFNHVAASGRFKDVRLDQLRRWGLDWQANRGFLARAARGEAAFSAEILCDLFLNAGRRREEGKYDDAVGRLYRLIEMIAQGSLMERGVDTANVDPARLPEAVRAAYEARRSPDSGKIILGLQEDYRILKEFGDPLGEAFIGNVRLRDLLTARNLSILAHGRAPVGREGCEALEAEARTILGQRVRDMDRTLQNGTFARLDLR